MSNGILKRKVGLMNGWDTKLSRMTESNEKENVKEDLPNFVRRIRTEKGLSLKAVEERSGGRISKGYVSQLENRYYINPTRDKLIALAHGLGVSEEEIFAIARGQSPTESPEYRNWKYAALFDDAQKLTTEQMTKFETIMEIARREVERMLQEQANDSPRKKSKKA